MRYAFMLPAAVVAVLAIGASAQTTATAGGSYKVITKAAVGGAGGHDYVYADSDGRKLYVPRGNRVDAYDLDSLKPVGSISPATGVHGAAVDPAAKHGFCSSSPVVMWDTETLKTIKTIAVEGKPDGILFDPFTHHVLILSHSAPNATVLDSNDGSIVGTIDLGGAPEQGASDGNGKLFISLEDESKVAVVDSKAMKVTATYNLAPKGGAPAGLAMDAKNHILFVSGREPPTCVVMNADDGSVITSLPIGTGVDSSSFNPGTMEAFVSAGDGTMTVIKEADPKTFTVEQTVQTMARAKTCTLDTKTNQVYLITNDPSVAPPAGTTAPAATAPADAPRGRGRGGNAGTFTILVVGKDAK